MTKTLTFKNSELVGIGNLLVGLNLKNKASRGRSKLVKLLVSKNDEYSGDRKEALDPYFKDGKLLEDKDGNVDEDNKAKAGTVALEIENELAVIEFTEYSEKMKALFDALTDYPSDFSNQDAIIYDLIMDQFEAAFENNEKDGEK